MEGQCAIMAVWTLHHREPYPQKPYLYFVAFCDQASIDALDENIPFPVGLEIASMPAEHFRSGQAWTELLARNPALAEEIERAPLAVAMHGTLATHESLDYLRETIDLMMALVDQGACAIYDVLTLTWRGAEEWRTLVSEGSIFNPFDHIVTARQTEPSGRLWVFTRGLRKFGRPDLVVREVEPEHVGATEKMLDRFINHQALGGVLEPDREVTMDGLKETYRTTAPQGDADSEPYRNSFVELRPI